MATSSSTDREIADPAATNNNALHQGEQAAFTMIDLLKCIESDLKKIAAKQKRLEEMLIPFMNAEEPDDYTSTAEELDPDAAALFTDSFEDFLSQLEGTGGGPAIAPPNFPSEYEEQVLMSPKLQEALVMIIVRLFSVDLEHEYEDEEKLKEGIDELEQSLEKVILDFGAVIETVKKDMKEFGDGDDTKTT